MMKCEEAKSLLTKYLLGDLEEAQASAVHAHIEKCESCSAEALEIQPTLDLLREALADTAPAPARLDVTKHSQIYCERNKGRVIEWVTDDHPLVKKLAVAMVIVAFIGIIAMIALPVKMAAKADRSPSSGRALQANKMPVVLDDTVSGAAWYSGQENGGFKSGADEKALSGVDSDYDGMPAVEELGEVLEKGAVKDQYVNEYVNVTPAPKSSAPRSDKLAAMRDVQNELQREVAIKEEKLADRDLEVNGLKNRIRMLEVETRKMTSSDETRTPVVAKRRKPNAALSEPEELPVAEAPPSLDATEVDAALELATGNTYHRSTTAVAGKMGKGGGRGWPQGMEAVPAAPVVAKPPPPPAGEGFEALGNDMAGAERLERQVSDGQPSRGAVHSAERAQISSGVRSSLKKIDDAAALLPMEITQGGAGGRLLRERKKSGVSTKSRKRDAATKPQQASDPFAPVGEKKAQATDENGSGYRYEGGLGAPAAGGLSAEAPAEDAGGTLAATGLGESKSKWKEDFRPFGTEWPADAGAAPKPPADDPFAAPEAEPMAPGAAVGYTLDAQDSRLTPPPAKVSAKTIADARILKGQLELKMNKLVEATEIEMGAAVAENGRPSGGERPAEVDSSTVFWAAGETTKKEEEARHKRKARNVDGKDSVAKRRIAEESQRAADRMATLQDEAGKIALSTDYDSMDDNAFPAGSAITYMPQVGKLMVADEPDNLVAFKKAAQERNEETVSEGDSVSRSGEAKQVPGYLSEKAFKEVAAQEGKRRETEKKLDVEGVDGDGLADVVELVDVVVDSEEIDEDEPVTEVEPVTEDQDGTRFIAYGVNPIINVSQNAFSTFSIDVDTASYTLTRNYIESGNLPPAEAVRTEEIVNYFDYAYKAPTHRTFAVFAEAAPSKFGRGQHLLKIGVKGKRLGREEQRRAALTFLIDTSGSMEKPDRIGLVKKSLNMLVDMLNDDDTVTIVQYDVKARIVVERMQAKNRKEIKQAIDDLQCNGSTNLEDGIQKAYEAAAKGFVSKGENRVLILSDGVANLGDLSAEGILAKVEKYRNQGIYCSVFGVGMGTYDDEMLETLANKGDGTYTYLDSEDEAKRLFVDDLAATLNTIAKDVKIQVEFNPNLVKTYRQLGYENRQLTKEQFRDDTVDAGEVGSGQSVTALYEIGMNPVVAKNANRRLLPEPVATVRVRYRRTDNDAVEEIEIPVTYKDFSGNFEKTDARFRLAACAAEFAEILRGSPYARGSSFQDVTRVLANVKLELNLDQRVQDFYRLTTAAPGMARGQ